MTRKEQIIEVLKKHIGECAISGDDADYLLFHLTKDILSLPIDVPSEKEIKKWAINRYGVDYVWGVLMEGAEWAINEIIERNK